MIRLYIFLGLLVLFLLWESVFPRRDQGPLFKNRLCNLLLSTLNTLLMFILPVSAAAAAQSLNYGDAGTEYGLLVSIEMPQALRFILSLIILDLIIYFQHIMFHSVPLFWQVHKVHHADSTLNVTSAVRYHPIEIVLSMGIKVGAVLLLGVSVKALFLFEILLNGCAMFNHACILLPPGVDRVMRLFIVTPDMHRVHHSLRLRETNRNFGFCLSLWDYLLGTYRKEAVQNHNDFKLGISPYRNHEERSLIHSLLMPFDGKGQSYSIKGMGKQGT